MSMHESKPTFGNVDPSQRRHVMTSLAAVTCLRRISLGLGDLLRKPGAIHLSGTIG